MYIDGTSSSMLVSAVVAGAAGAGVVAKTQWRRMTGAFKGKKGAAPVESTATDTTETTK